ncbi:MAG: LysE family translocator [Xanthobacteraceae bacterium]|nr:LysE family translocator [Xanthobacteraceae bacterium]
MGDIGGIPFSTLASFVLTSLVIEVTPGPNMTYLALVAATEGRRAGFATVGGIALGLAAVGAVAGVGVAEAIHASDLLYAILRWAGVVFLLYLAWDGWRSPAMAAPHREGEDGKYFLRGLLTNLLNPKAGVFYIAVLPTFMTPQLPPVPQAMTLTAIYVGIATLVHAAIVVLAGTLEPLLNDPRRETVVRRVLSALLALVALWFAWATAPA